MPHNDQQVKKNLFGEVKKAPATSGHKPDINKIAEILKDGAVIGIFCVSCGYTHGFTQQGAEDIAKASDLELPTDLNSVFFTTKRCSICDDKYQGVKIEPR